MIDLQQQASMERMENFQLVTVTFDPEYDSPGMLRQYANQRGASFDNYHFLTGSKSAIEDLMRQFGILKEYKDRHHRSHNGYVAD